MTALAEVRYEPVYPHMPFVRRMMRDPVTRRRAVVALAELVNDDEMNKQDVLDMLADGAQHLTAKQLDEEFEELRWVLDRHVVASADGTGQPDDMSLPAWIDSLERRAKEQVQVLCGGTP